MKLFKKKLAYLTMAFIPAVNSSVYLYLYHEKIIPNLDVVSFNLIFLLGTILVIIANLAWIKYLLNDFHEQSIASTSKGVANNFYILFVIMIVVYLPIMKFIEFLYGKRIQYCVEFLLIDFLLFSLGVYFYRRYKIPTIR